jgi:hypothetical protein
MKNLNPRASFLPLLTLALALLQGCGKDSHDAASNATVSKSTAAPAAAKCANPVPLDAVPASWVRVEGKDFITGKRGRYELTQVQLQEEIAMGDGSIVSASTNTEILNRELGDDGITQSVTCKDLGSGRGKFSLNTKPVDSISRVDGSYSERRSVDFVIYQDRAEKSTRAYAVKESARFGQETEASRAQEERLRKSGSVFDSRTYRISEEEFELRVTATVADEQGSGRTVTFNAAFRYKLKR